MCTGASGLEPILDKTTCKTMAGTVKRCNDLIDACKGYPVPEVCALAERYCSKNLADPFFRTGRNYYDSNQPPAKMAHGSFSKLHGPRGLMYAYSQVNTELFQFAGGTKGAGHRLQVRKVPGLFESG